MKSISKVFIIALTIVLAVLLPVVVTPVLASSGHAPAQQEPQVMGLSEFLVYLASGGAIFVVSWLLEYTGWFQALAAKGKQLVFFGFALVIALGAHSINTYVPAEALAEIAPFFKITAVTFTLVFFGSGFHKITKKA